MSSTQKQSDSNRKSIEKSIMENLSPVTLNGLKKIKGRVSPDAIDFKK